MTDYQLTGSSTIVRAVDGASIPNDPSNRDRAEYDAWVAAGNVPDPYVAPMVEPSFIARDLMAQFTPDDYAAIQTAIASNAALGLLWASLLAQGDTPIMASSDRFRQGWSGLTKAIGGRRAKDIAAAVGIPG